MRAGSIVAALAAVLAVWPAAAAHAAPESQCNVPVVCEQRICVELWPPLPEWTEIGDVRDICVLEAIDDQ